MKKNEYKFSYDEYDDFADCPIDCQNLIKEAIEAMRKAYAPYSKFKVGAAVLLDNGVFVRGNNQENASFPVGSCAEKVAVHYAGATYPEAKIVAIAIVAANAEGILPYPISPCGLCRQVLLESEKHANSDIKVILHGEKLTQVISSSRLLLPLSFDSDTL